MGLRNYELDQSSIVEEFLSRALVDYADEASRVPAIWRAMEKSGQVRRMASVSLDLLNYIAASYSFEEEMAFTKACQCFMKFSLAKSTAIKANRMQLSPDISIAISLGWQDDAQIVASALLSDSSLSENEPAEAVCAYILAALTDLDFALVSKVSEQFAGWCSSKRYTKYECALYAEWAGAASAIANRDSTIMVRHLEKIDSYYHQHISKELNRWKKGQSTDLMAADFWDYQTTALIAIAIDLGLVNQDSGIVRSAFSDSIWTREHGYGNDC